MPLDKQLSNQFVTAAHGDAAKVRTMLAAEPELIGAKRMGETALGAAAHMGHREIAELLLDAGAPLDICAAAMLGRRDDVASILAADPAKARAKGAHGIGLIFHIALGGDVAIAEMVVANGGGDGADRALHGAIANGHVAMVEWLLAHGADDINVADWQKKTPLRAARERGHEAIVEILRAKGGHE